MAVQVFKDGESIFIQPKSLQNHLKQGWSVDDPNAPKRSHNLDLVHPHRHIGHIDVPPDASEEEQEQAALEAMGIVPRETPSIDNVVIGATRIPLSPGADHHPV